MDRPMKVWPTSHRCPWPGCPVKVDADLWGCRGHWFAIPRELRMALWKAYRRGQTAASASPEYREAHAAINAWIKAYTESGGSTQQPRRKGHGWITPNPDGTKARCGGPKVCHTCQREQRELAKLDERQGDLLL